MKKAVIILILLFSLSINAQVTDKAPVSEQKADSPAPASIKKETAPTPPDQKDEDDPEAQNIPKTFEPVGISSFGLYFIGLALGIVGMNSSHPLFEVIRFLNPMWWANRIILVGVAECLLLIIVVMCFFILSFLTTLRFLRINPVWSRYFLSGFS